MRGVFAIALCMTLPSPAWAALPLEPAVRVLVRVLSYDRALSERVTGELRAAIVYDARDPVSTAQALETSLVLRGLAGAKLGELRLSSEVDLLSGGGDLGDYGAVFLCRGVDHFLPELIEEADAHDVLLLSLDDALMGRGPAVGVAQRQARLQILVDLEAASSQGAKLSSDVLQLAEIVKAVP